ncbi:uncharacterized protein LOC144707819 [Wolffia australiana]
MAMAASAGTTTRAGHIHIFFPRQARCVLRSLRRSSDAFVPSIRSQIDRKFEKQSVIRPGSEAARKPLPPGGMTFSSSISTELPLHESPEVSFDEYLDDRPRIFRAMFPDHRRSLQLNDEDWRVQMLPIEFLFASVNPIVVMRLRCSPEMHPNLSRTLELRVIRWELRGLEGVYSPPHFELDVRGTLFADRGGRRSRLRGSLQMSIGLVLPPVFSLVPEQVLRGVADSVLRRLLDKMREDVNANLLSDFQSFRREKMNQKLILNGTPSRRHADPAPPDL